MLDIGVDSYLTVEEANDFIKELYMSSEDELKLWEGLTDSNKEVLLRRGTLALDKLCYVGRRDVSANRLKFPRYINGQNVTPVEIKKGALIQGVKAHLLKSSANYKKITSGVKSMTVGPNSVSFADNVQADAVFDEVLALIRPYVVTSIRAVSTY